MIPPFLTAAGALGAAGEALGAADASGGGLEDAEAAGDGEGCWEEPGAGLGPAVDGRGVVLVVAAGVEMAVAWRCEAEAG